MLQDAYENTFWTLIHGYHNQPHGKDPKVKTLITWSPWKDSQYKAFITIRGKIKIWCICEIIYEFYIKNRLILSK